MKLVDDQEEFDLMARLLVHVEGETEENFVNEVLRPHLFPHGYEMVSARIVGNARQRDRRGGIRAWSAVLSDIVKHLKEDSGAIATTMVDYYGLPQTGGRAWPGRAMAATVAFEHKAQIVEDALLRDVSQAMGEGFDTNRFIPFVIMHEFEGLLFSDCGLFARGVGQPGLGQSFQAIRNQFANPEQINDSPLSAPSKRVQEILPGYEKPLMGTLAALEIGLEKIRAECPHFRQWLERLESLQPTS